MAVDYIPTDDEQLVIELQNFATTFASYALTLGFVAGDIFLRVKAETEPPAF